MTFAKEAWPFVLPFVLLAGVLVFMRHPVWAGVAALLAVGILLFFRDPHRSFAGDPSIVLSAADGMVTGVDVVEDPEIGPGRYRRVVTFLSVFDVHIQRMPVQGQVLLSRFREGKKVAAFREDAGEVNQQHLTVLVRQGAASGDRVAVRQLAGLVARRVVCRLQPGQTLDRGEHLGLIKFGSRVDVMVPEDYEVLVSKGDRLRAGETPIAQPAAQR